MNTIINFMVQLAPLIESGRIPHAIRPCLANARNPEPGDLLYLYAGRNTPGSRLLSTVVCEYVASITILPTFGPMPQVIVGSEMLDTVRLDSLAKDAGFADDESMIGYYQSAYGLPFNGNLIGWAAQPSYLTTH
jgi:hypothetical protein